MKVSIKQISEYTGFSPATVSNALNYKKGVNRNTSEQIFRAARELGYLEENRITKVKFVKYKKNGLIVDGTPFFTLMIEGAMDECRKHGLEMVVSTLDARDPNYDEQVRWLINDKSAAVILLGTELMEEDLDIFRGAVCPFLLLDNWCTDMGFDAVLINNSDSARIATQYLIGKGHKEIGYLMGSFRINAFRSRAMGYQMALNRAGLPVDKKYTVTLLPTMDGSYKDMKKYLGKKPQLPTAFFADNDMVALGAMKAFTEAGIRIPDEVSIIGFDDLTFSAISSPGLTTLRVSQQNMGRVAVQRLLMLMNGETTHLKIQVCTEFIERESVKNLRKSS
ncbi:MAG: LacI family DNA-binding transcriptional regulator [Clostridiales bacterium]|nr:LacI family DNA-binding transcriptional regulator [Clostridiales bacterium]